MHSSVPDCSRLPATVLIALFLALVATGRADDRALFDKANAAYLEGRFAEAVAIHQSEGPRSINGFYNLGNAWHRANEPGRAALAYERTLLLAPTHFEARHNLARVRTAAGVTSAAPRWWEAVPADLPPLLTSIAGWGVLFSLVGLWRCARGSTGRRVAGRTLFPALAVVGMAIPLGMLLGRGTKDPRAAILVAARPVSARFAPTQNAGEVAQVAPGERVRILSQAAGWDYCALASNVRGWLPSGQVERIRPFIAVTGK